jgi:hypothetical protein
LSVAELSLHEFLLDQILFLQESLEPWLVPRIVEELLGRERVSPPGQGHPMSFDCGGGGGGGAKATEVRLVVVRTPGPPLVGAWVVVRHPTKVQVLLSSSQESVTSSSSAWVAMTQCISYAKCYGKVVKSFKARPPKLADSELGSSWYSC